MSTAIATADLELNRDLKTLALFIALYCRYKHADAEHKPENEEDLRNFVELFRDADVVVFDAMYSLAESVSVREDWGHSSNVVGVELCQRANVKRLVLFHH